VEVNLQTGLRRAFTSRTSQMEMKDTKALCQYSLNRTKS